MQLILWGNAWFPSRDCCFRSSPPARERFGWTADRQSMAGSTGNIRPLDLERRQPAAMQTFTVSVEVSCRESGLTQTVDALVGGGNALATMPSSLLHRLGIQPDETMHFRAQDGDARNSLWATRIFRCKALRSLPESCSAQRTGASWAQIPSHPCCWDQTQRCFVWSPQWGCCRASFSLETKGSEINRISDCKI